MAIGTGKGVFTVEEAHQYLAISRAELYRLLAAGVLKGFHIGRRRLIPREELDRFIQDQLAAEDAPGR